MNSSKLISLIKSLSDKEIREFSKYLKSSFFNRDQHIIKLYAYIRKIRPIWESSKLNKTIVFKKLFKGEEYTARKINDVMSDLCIKLEDYLIFVESQKRPIDRSFLYLRSLKSRKLNRQFFNELKTLRKSLEQQDKRDMDYYYCRFVLGMEGYLHPNTTLQNRAGQIELNNYLHQLTDNLDRFYISSKLRFYNEIKVQNKMTSNSYSTNLISEILELIKNYSYNDDLIIQMYSLFFQLEDATSNKMYEKLKSLIFQNYELLEKEELFDLIAGLTHYNNDKMKKSKNPVQYAKEMLLLYKFQEEKGLLIFDGLIPPNVFTSIVNIAVGLKDLDWAEMFIAKYLPYIHKNERENIEGLNKGRLQFGKGNYKDVLTETSKVSLKQFHYSLQARILEIQCLYEQGDIAQANAYCDKFYRYLIRKEQLSELVKQAGFNFISVIRKLNDVNRLPKKELLSILDKMPVYSKAWLTEVIQRLKK